MTSVSDLKDRSTAMRRVLDQKIGQRAAVRAALSRAEEQFHDTKEARDRSAGAHRILQVAAEKMREQLKTALENTATRALRFVFQRDYAVEFRIAVKHGQLTGECWVSETGTWSKALDGHGGGIADVLAFVLRVAVLRASRKRQFLVADEPFKFVNSPDAMARLKEILVELAEGGLQMLFVSSREDLVDVRGAKVFRMDSGDRGSVLEDV